MLDNSNNPLQNVKIRLFRTNQGSNNSLPMQIGTPVSTDSKGYFEIKPAPVGIFKIMADGSTAGAFPTLEYDLLTIAGQENTLGMPIYLPKLDTVNKLCVDQNTGGSLVLPQTPGFKLTVAPGSATFPGGSRSGCITVTVVNGIKCLGPGLRSAAAVIVTFSQ